MRERIILLADDDIDDSEMFCEALAGIDKNIKCECVVNGEKLFEALNVFDINPELIFLDLNMPIMNGWECLKLLKNDSKYKHIPVVIISTSSHITEIENTLGLGANCYFVKPSDFNDLMHVLEILTDNVFDLEKGITKLKNERNKYIFF